LTAILPTLYKLKYLTVFTFKTSFVPFEEKEKSRERKTHARKRGYLFERVLLLMGIGRVDEFGLKIFENVPTAGLLTETKIQRMDFEM